MNLQTLWSKVKGITLALLCVSPGGTANAAPPVPAALEPVTNTYHGEVVTDNYQWLENFSAPATKDWIRLQNERTRSYFGHLNFRDGIAQQLAEIRGEES